MTLAAVLPAPLPAPMVSERPVPAPLLEVRDLSINFHTRSGEVRALEQVSFDLRRGEIVGVVGESGSGKSVLSLALMGLLDAAGRVTSGTAQLHSADGSARALFGPERAQRAPIAMVFQSPRTALNPIRRVGEQLADVLRMRDPLLRDPRDQARSLLAQVKITDPERRLDAYPFELSGGMCQRVMIALALACRPALLIADEPTTGLDVTTQAAIMDLIRQLSRQHGMSTLFITHDLNLAAESCERLIVMHAGHVVEQGPTERLLAQPRHPYTARLIAATPHALSRLVDLSAIPGKLPDLRKHQPPCRFSARCERALPACLEGPVVSLASLPGGPPEHRVACRNPLP